MLFTAITQFFLQFITPYHGLNFDCGLEMNSTVVNEKIQFYTAKLDATRRQLEVTKTSFFKAKTATTKIKWPTKPPTEKMRLLLRIVSFLNYVLFYGYKT